tara:strand:- start:128 stop:265 length:138 start_codon:yes stop_codon:yes gene_type:complete
MKNDPKKYTNTTLLHNILSRKDITALFYRELSNKNTYSSLSAQGI